MRIITQELAPDTWQATALLWNDSAALTAYGTTEAEAQAALDAKCARYGIDAVHMTAG